MRAPLLLVAVLLLAGCGAAPSSSRSTLARAAEPQRAELDWRESYPSTGQRLLFAVDSLDVTQEGLVGRHRGDERDDDPVRPRSRSGPTCSFGLMLFANDSLDELEAAADDGRLPPASPGDSVRPSSARRARAERRPGARPSPPRARSPTAPTSASRSGRSGEGRAARGMQPAWSGSRTGRTGSRPRRRCNLRGPKARRQGGAMDDETTRP